MASDKEITVNVELELCYSLEEKVEEKETPFEVNSDEMIAMMEERSDSSKKKENDLEEENVELEKEPKKEALKNDKEEKRNETEDLLINPFLNDNEYTTYHIHIVKEGETVETICSLYQTTADFLKNYNDIENLTLGSKIIIPTDDES